MREKEKIKRKKEEEWMTDNEIGIEGSKAMSEMLRVNKTLATLNLSSEEEGKQENKKRKKERRMGDRQWNWR